MPKIIIDQECCKGCFLCISACPRGLIKLDNRLNKKGIRPVKFINNGKCSGCLQCALVCPDCCIEVYK